jgi:hypothetical protein
MTNLKRFFTVLGLTLASWVILILAIYGAVRLYDRYIG